MTAAGPAWSRPALPFAQTQRCGPAEPRHWVLRGSTRWQARLIG